MYSEHPVNLGLFGFLSLSQFKKMLKPKGETRHLAGINKKQKIVFSSYNLKHYTVIFDSVKWAHYIEDNQLFRYSSVQPPDGS